MLDHSDVDYPVLWFGGIVSRRHRLGAFAGPACVDVSGRNTCRDQRIANGVGPSVRQGQIIGRGSDTISPADHCHARRAGILDDVRYGLDDLLPSRANLGAVRVEIDLVSCTGQLRCIRCGRLWRR